ncbi:MAG: hypothetical protein JW864_17575 [Spirochaetes bacterium]|nr:hypothetical protein [Spirochaetota bacterium]
MKFINLRSPNNIYLLFLNSCLAFINKNKIYFFLFLFLLFSRELYSGPVYSFDWYWVFYEEEQKDNYSNFTFRPFFLRNIENGKKIYEASLPPVVYWKYERPGKSEWKSLFGLVGSLDYTHKSGIKDYDFGIFPFLLYGNSPDPRDRYLHIWPFGGTIKGKLAQDKITAYTFPGFLLFFIFPPAFPPTWTTIAVALASLMPAYVEYQSRDYKAFGVLWPLIQRGTSPVRDDIRILPFYAHNYKKDYYDNYSVLMLFNYQQQFFKDDTEKTFFAFPFYGRRWNQSSTRGSGTLFWPFFSWGYDKKRGNSELNFPWPLVQIQTCRKPRIRKRIFFPFYGKYEYEDTETFFLTPLHFSLKKRRENFESEYYVNLFIVWYFKREYKNEPSPIYGSSWRYFKIWPLFQYEYDDRNNLSFNFLSLLPFRDPEGYEKMYQPFWTLFEYRRFETGEKRLGLLLRLYYQQWSNDFFRVKVPLLLSWGSHDSSFNNLSFMDYLSLLCYNNDEQGKYLGFLFSMFSYCNDSDGNYIRIFWIPLNIGAEKNAARNARNTSAREKQKDDNNTDSSLMKDHYSMRKSGRRISNNITMFTIRIF